MFNNEENHMKSNRWGEHSRPSSMWWIKSIEKQKKEKKKKICLLDYPITLFMFAWNPFCRFFCVTNGNIVSYVLVHNPINVNGKTSGTLNNDIPNEQSNIDIHSCKFDDEEIFSSIFRRFKHHLDQFRCVCTMRFLLKNLIVISVRSFMWKRWKFLLERLSHHIKHFKSAYQITTIRFVLWFYKFSFWCTYRSIPPHSHTIIEFT